MKTRGGTIGGWRMTSAETGTDIHRRSVLTGYAMIVVAVTFWGGSAALAKYLFTKAYSTLVITQMRSTLSFVLLAAFFVVKDRAVFRIDRKDLPAFLGVGVIGIAMTNYVYYVTVELATVATAILIQYTAPALVTMYMVYIAREEKASNVKLISLALALVGCYFAVTGNGASLQLPGWSVVTGPASAIFFAYILVASKRLLRKYSQWTVLLYAFGIAGLFWLFVNPPWVIAEAGYSAEDWGVFWFFAICSILIPHSLFTASLRTLEASTAGIVSTLEPVIAIGAAWLLLGETLTMFQVGGAVLILFAVLLLQVIPRTSGRIVPGEHV